MTTARQVYISGPMTGYPEFNFPAFHAAETAWREAGWEVLNPARNANGDTSRPWSYYIRLDIAMLLEADAIAYLPGWEKSRGASLEMSIAVALGLYVYDAGEPAHPPASTEEGAPGL